MGMLRGGIRDGDGGTSGHGDEPRSYAAGAPALRPLQRAPSPNPAVPRQRPRGRSGDWIREARPVQGALCARLTKGKLALPALSRMEPNELQGASSQLHLPKNKTLAR